MRLESQHYFHAALERRTDAYVSHENARYSLSIYISGRAVECVLRAFAHRRDPRLDVGHDLRLLFKQCGLGKMLEVEARPQVAQAVNAYESAEIIVRAGEALWI